MSEKAESKAKRRRRLRQAFPAPLNQVAMRHVDGIQSLEGNQRAILAKAIAQVGIVYVPNCLAAIKNSSGAIQSETDLIALLDLIETPKAEAVEDVSSGEAPDQEVEGIDMDYLASLLIKCYPDMPQAAADALVGSEVMAPSLRVVSTTRLALVDAKSDFVITALYTLFEEKLDEIEQVIANNPAFIKAMQLSRSDWKPN